MQKELSLQGPTAQQHDEQEAFERALWKYAGIDPARFEGKKAGAYMAPAPAGAERGPASCQQQRKIVDTHLIYQTIGHQHLDTLVNWATGTYPDAGINLVECYDGRWFVEVDFGTIFDSMEGVSRPKVSPFSEPRFWDTEQAARDFAIACIKRAHPEIADKNLQEWFDDYDKDE